MSNLLETRTAYFSTDRKYRYWLKIVWNPNLPLLIVIGLNPSTADEQKDDPTVRRCKQWARNLHCGGLLMLNAFAFRATDPVDMMMADDPVGPENNRVLLEMTANAFITLCAWGNTGIFKNRSQEILQMFAADGGRKLKCLRFTKLKQPEHPLFVPYAAELQELKYDTHC